MKFSVLTLFPEMLSALSESIIGRAINKGIIENSYILVPPDETLILYNKYTEKIYKQIIKISLSTLKLINIKNNILPLLINGQLR